MSDTLYVQKLNEVYVRLICPDWMAAEISDHFSFKLPSAKFHPAVKAKAWDGTIRLFNSYTRVLYQGLVPALSEFCKRNGYQVEFEYDVGDQEVSEVEVSDFINKLKTKGLWPKFEIADDQRRAFVAYARKKRVTMLSPTGSGKSFLIYLACWWFKRKTLIIVPRVGLALQMYKDLVSYGMPEEYMHVITAGEEKNPPLKVKITLEDRSIYHVLGSQSIETLNRGKVLAAELMEGDEIDERLFQK